MRRKKIFSDEKIDPSRFLGIERRSLSFTEFETKPPGSLASILQRLVPKPLIRVVRKVRTYHFAIALATLICALFLYWLFTSLLPSPFALATPKSGSHVKGGKITILIEFRKPIKKEEFNLWLDGKEVTELVRFTEKGATLQTKISDGKHTLKASATKGILIKKKTRQWYFTADSIPPELMIFSKKMSRKKDKNGQGLIVSFRGKTEINASVTAGGKNINVLEDGSFEGHLEASEGESFEITASDAAGNTSSYYILTQKPVQAKGVHVSMFAAGNENSFKKILDLIEKTELNCIQLDLKDEQGFIGAKIDKGLPAKLGTFADQYDIERTVDMLRYREIYTICRIVVFKDPALVKKRPDLGVRDKYGGLWGRGLWADPYSKEVWDYNISLAITAARAGFNEIQFDYIRFPSDGDVTRCVYPHRDSRTQNEVIEGFVSYARKKLAKYNAFTSLDLFGLTASHQGEMGIGQRVESLAKHVDYISPMVYPSHYNRGEYGLDDPEENPYDTVYLSLKDFKKKTRNTTVKIRPWLQDFSLRVKYTADMVRKQIDACHKAGIKEWLLWNPNSVYTKAALKRSGED